MALSVPTDVRGTPKATQLPTSISKVAPAPVTITQTPAIAVVKPAASAPSAAAAANAAALAAQQKLKAGGPVNASTEAAGMTYSALAGNSGYQVGYDPVTNSYNITGKNAAGQAAYNSGLKNWPTSLAAAITDFNEANGTHLVVPVTSSVTTTSPGTVKKAQPVAKSTPAAASTSNATTTPLISTIGAVTSPTSSKPASAPSLSTLLGNPLTTGDTAGTQSYTSGGSGDESGIGSSDTSMPPPSTADVEALQPTPATTTSSGPSTLLLVLLGVGILGGLAYYFLVYEKHHKAPSGGDSPATA